MILYVNDKKTYDEAVATIDKWTIMGVDTETTGLDPYKSEILLLQIGNEYHQFVFDVYALRSKGIDFKEIKNILESEYPLKIGHNLVFDYKMIKQNLNIELENIFDTMIAEYLLTKGLKLSGFGLDDILTKYNICKDMDKGERKSFTTHRMGSRFTEEQIQYAAKDVEHLIPLARTLQKLIDNVDMRDLLDLENETVLVTGDLELAGMLLNKEEWAALAFKAHENKLKAREELMKFVPRNLDTIELKPEKSKAKAKKNRGSQQSFDLDVEVDVNFSSPAQVLGLLSVITGKVPEDTNEKTLYIAYTRADGTLHPFVSSLLKYREADKLATTYGMAFYDENVHPITGRVHSSFLQMGTDSGRYSSRSPNLQNIPAKKEYRKAFKAPLGYKIIGADLAQFELRVLAELSSESSWIQVMADPEGDLHRFVASRLYNMPENDITKPLRTIGKALNFSVAYGAGPKKLMETCNKAFTDLEIDRRMTFEEAKDILDKYRKAFPKIAKVLDEAVVQAKRLHYALSPLDKRRRYFDIDWTDPAMLAHVGNISKNMLCQAVNASVTKRALCKIRKQIKENNYDAKIIVTVHDEVQCECLESQSIEFAEIIKTEFISAGKHYLKTVPVDVSLQISDNWEK